ncbi:hypothetical protein SNE40_010417 [Patella caerulea]|uniref:Uncharacterized protein n=1 Tax=Patella caerulea TaxID=87958 RepID=A0AAN8JXX4_PATCE
MLDFTTAPLHLMTPLTVDTNIDYTLDMNRFPGLNSEESMKELALLPSTSSGSVTEGPYVCELCGNLIPYLTDDSVPCGFCVYYGLIVEDNNSITEQDSDELFSLIASCDIDTEFENMHSGDLQSVLEDIIESTSSSTSPSTSPSTSLLSEQSLDSVITQELFLSPLPKLSPLSPVESSDLDSFISVTSETNKSTICETDYSFCVKEIAAIDNSDVTYEDIFTDSTCVPDVLDIDTTFFSPAVYDTSIRKRKLSTDVESKLSKRQKSCDIDDILLNCFSDFSRVNDKAEAMSRES